MFLNLLDNCVFSSVPVVGMTQQSSGLILRARDMCTAGDEKLSGGRDRFPLPPYTSFTKHCPGESLAYVFRYRALGEIGRILLQALPDGRFHPRLLRVDQRPRRPEDRRLSRDLPPPGARLGRADRRHHRPRDRRRSGSCPPARWHYACRPTSSPAGSGSPGVLARTIARMPTRTAAGR